MLSGALPKPDAAEPAAEPAVAGVEAGMGFGAARFLAAVLRALALATFFTVFLRRAGAADRRAAFAFLPVFACFRRFAMINPPIRSNQSPKPHAALP